MQVSVPLVNGMLADKYGKYAPVTDMLADYPTKSFPIRITDAPADTRTFVPAPTDYDSAPVRGFIWIHWLTANIPATLTDILASASRELADKLVQGNNSNAGSLVSGNPLTTSGYVGPQPPDKTYDCTLTVFALDDTLPLGNRYWLNDFIHAAKDHILAKAQIGLSGRARGRTYNGNKNFL